MKVLYHMRLVSLCRGRHGVLEVVVVAASGAVTVQSLQPPSGSGHSRTRAHLQCTAAALPVTCLTEDSHVARSRSMSEMTAGRWLLAPRAEAQCGTANLRVAQIEAPTSSMSGATLPEP